ncbi:MAG TPA: tRNA preQ1(34) S-adenosylmethionine ribosyltransferase-isomerase QueA [Caldisericia bacterium]|nr:tRNA preQ1(34) S-adenosylmethionine ribosyltransferase-isomerase QueA [Caldisericia bacterium]
MDIDLFNYDLPKELIAQKPLKNRDEARLLVLKRESNEIFHSYFYNLPEFLDSGDLLILNNSKVIKAKLEITLDTGGKLDAIFLRGNENKIEILCEKSKKLKLGRKIFFKDKTEGIVKGVLDGGRRVIEIEDLKDHLSFLNRVGEVPLPPYIKEKDIDSDDYQTIYAEVEGSIAAPTAGFHFTENLFNNLRNKGILIEYITLHIGTPTFKPLKVKDIDNYQIGEEYYEIDEKVIKRIKETKEKKKRVVAVGTTVVRALESLKIDGETKSVKGKTNIFIKPPFDFKVVDAIITNFHLPKTSLLILVSAFAGRDKILNAYKIAIENKYRFYSFGDGMLIL